MRFRLLVDARDRAADGAWNMAVDEALLQSAMLGDAVPALRVYRFARPTITFGYGQSVADAVDEDACRRRAVDVVRRITGGRALVHQHELTYSFTAPPLATSVRDTYNAVTGALRSALDQLGVPVDPPIEPDIVRAPRHLPCLAVPTGHEITSGNKKIVASAMRFRRKGFLQHGSILWSVDHRLWSQLTRLGDDPMPAVGIRDLNVPCNEDDLIEALSSAVEALLGGSPIVGELSSEESARVTELAEKYRSQAWTRERAKTGTER